MFSPAAVLKGRIEVEHKHGCLFFSFLWQTFITVPLEARVREWSWHHPRLQGACSLVQETERAVRSTEEGHPVHPGRWKGVESISKAPPAWSPVAVPRSIFLPGAHAGKLGVTLEAPSLSTPVSPPPKVLRTLPLPPIMCFKAFRASALPAWLGVVAPALSPFHITYLPSGFFLPDAAGGICIKHKPGHGISA